MERSSSTPSLRDRPCARITCRVRVSQHVEAFCSGCSQRCSNPGKPGPTSHPRHARLLGGTSTCPKPTPENHFEARVRTHTFDVANLGDAVGIREISDRLGYPEAVVRRWLKRGVLPDPAVMLAGSPVWEWAEVLRWAHAAGRDDRLTWLP